MNRKPILIFDTSAINALADDKGRESLVAGLRSGYHLRLTGTIVEEIYANTCRNRRIALLNLCERLLSAGDCIWPHHWIIETQMRYFAKDYGFNWLSISPVAPAYEQEIVRREILTDELAQRQRECAKDLEKEFAHLFGSPRPEFDALFATGTSRPSSFREFLPSIHGDGGALWKCGRDLYKRVTGQLPDENTIQTFATRCPPFHAFLLAVAMAQWERCVRDLTTPVSYRAGREDLWMSVYLLYCDLFITCDPKQERCLREVASEGHWDVEVLSYRDLQERLLI